LARSIQQRERGREKERERAHERERERERERKREREREEREIVCTVGMKRRDHRLAADGQTLADIRPGEMPLAA